VATERGSAEQPTDEISAKWREISDIANTLIRRAGTRGELSIEPGSALAGDDRVLGNKYPLSTPYGNTLGASIDHLHAVTALVVGQQALHVAAPASLARGVLENAGTAFWLAHPRSRDERVMRALRWWYQDAKDSDRATGLGTSPKRLKELQAIADARQLPVDQVKQKYSSTDVLTYAEEHARYADGQLLEPLFAWRLCSGFAHGKIWANLAASKIEMFETHDPRVSEARLTNDPAHALYPVRVGAHLIEAVLRVHSLHGKGPP